jgi:hypothetical protein
MYLRLSVPCEQLSDPAMRNEIFYVLLLEEMGMLLETQE